MRRVTGSSPEVYWPGKTGSGTQEKKRRCVRTSPDLESHSRPVSFSSHAPQPIYFLKGRTHENGADGSPRSIGWNGMDTRRNVHDGFRSTLSGRSTGPSRDG